MKQPIDPFKNINLDDFKNTNKPESRKTLLNQKTIRVVAQESNFKSRDVSPAKEKIITKTFSLFKKECDIINHALKFHLENYGYDISQPSGSDIVRAALHLFSKKTPEEQMELIKKHRGRGRK